ncbi:hypothetical protein SLE2022_291560 [Rubroshorea leprosula]
METRLFYPRNRGMSIIMRTEKMFDETKRLLLEVQLKELTSKERDAKLGFERLRAARGLAPLNKTPEVAAEPVSEPKSGGHFYPFERIKIFDPIQVLVIGE